MDVWWPAHWRDDHGTDGEGMVLDISPRGAFIRPRAELGTLHTLGSRLDVRFSTNDGRVVSVRAKIRWIGPSVAHGCFGYGVEFDDRNDTLEAIFAAAQTDYLEKL